MSSPSPPPSDAGGHDTVFTISLTVYSITKKTVKNKSTTKEEKSIKTKELPFAINDSETNYIDFLRAALVKHNQGLFKITEAKCYPFKYTIGIKRKASDAMDVDNGGDYKEMAKKIDDERPTAIKIFIDMKDIEKLPRGKKAMADEDEQNSSDEEQHEEAGEATLSTPPNINSFDIAHKVPVLNPARKASQPVTAPTPTADIDQKWPNFGERDSGCDSTYPSDPNFVIVTSRL
ncbi:hypothetical protein BDN67DRAFT_1017968 [Paxillus ammoniavirescens]|nr:hypothetical protein BDN67DRAFT_1017968 [Paxillus ammoniavirescens]